MIHGNELSKRRLLPTRSPGWVWLALAVVLLFAIGVRLRLAPIPLERDEGEYAYAGQLILQGIPPYQLAYNMKLPGTYVAYAGLMSVFGQDPRGVHHGLLLVNLATLVLLFMLARRWSGDTAAVIAAASFAVLSVSPSVLGFAGHATHFIMVPVLGGMLLLAAQSPPGRARVFAAGLLFGAGVLMKQSGAAFVPLGLALVLRSGWAVRDSRRHRMLAHAALFGAGVLAPYAAVCLWLFSAGVFDRFWFWTVTYAREYASLVPLAEGFAILRDTWPRVISSGAPLWALAGIGLIAPVWHRPARRTALALAGFLLVSFIAVCPGLYFRSHYFIVMLPAVSMLAGVAVDAVSTGLTALAGRPASRITAGGLAAFCLAWPLFTQRDFFFRAAPVDICRAVYGINPFVESEPIAAYLKAHSSTDAKIAVVGSEPQIYFLVQRHSATGYIYTYGLMEPHPYALTMQREMMREITETRPEYLVYVRIPTSWLPQPGVPTEIFLWVQNHAQMEYELVGAVDRDDSGQTAYVWGEDARRHPHASRSEILIWKRRSGR